MLFKMKNTYVGCLSIPENPDGVEIFHKRGLKSPEGYSNWTTINFVIIFSFSLYHIRITFAG